MPEVESLRSLDLRAEPPTELIVTDRSMVLLEPDLDQVLQHRKVEVSTVLLSIRRRLHKFCQV